MSRKTLCMCAAMLLIALIVDAAFCGITSEQVKAASKGWGETIKDWMPLAVSGGLSFAGVMFFANKYAYALGAIGGTAFLFGAQKFMGDGSACLITAAQLLLN